MNSETFGQRLSRLRRHHHLTQRELARLIGATDWSISVWESDQQRPRAKWRPLLARVFGVTECYLRTGSEAVIAPLPPIKSGIRWEAQPAADVQSFRVMWNDGVITRKMARRLGINLGTIHKVRKRLGLPPRKADIARSGGYAS